MTVFFDVDTQLDFLLPAGALYVPGAEHVIASVARLNQYAEANGIPVISTADAHAENDPEFRSWPSHCVAGTLGQQKPSSTLLSGRVVVPNKPIAAFFPAPQIILEKTVFDAFSNPNLVSVLDSLRPERYVVYGVVTEICVRRVLQGLVSRGGARIELVVDAVRSLNDADSDATAEELQAAGGTLTTVAEVCG